MFTRKWRESIKKIAVFFGAETNVPVADIAAGQKTSQTWVATPGACCWPGEAVIDELLPRAMRDSNDASSQANSNPTFATRRKNR